MDHVALSDLVGMPHAVEIGVLGSLSRPIRMQAQHPEELDVEVIIDNDAGQSLGCPWTALRT